MLTPPLAVAATGLPDGPAPISVERASSAGSALPGSSLPTPSTPLSQHLQRRRPGLGSGAFPHRGPMGPKGARVLAGAKVNHVKRLTEGQEGPGSGPAEAMARPPAPTDALLTVDAVGSKRVWRLLSSRSKPGVQSGVGISPSGRGRWRSPHSCTANKDQEDECCGEPA